MSKNNRKIDAKDAWERLWKCRDFEIEHLWQRSIFLATFLVLCFTGYGYIIFHMLKHKLWTDPSYNIVAIVLCIIGIVFSIVWIIMGKGSKAWYEVYEKFIKEFVKHNKKCFTKEAMKGMAILYLKKQYIFVGDKCLLTLKGGPFSPSKINTIIGHISLVVWMIGGIVHLCLLLKSNQCSTYIESLCHCHIIISCVCVITLVYLTYRCFSKWLNSHSLQTRSSVQCGED